MVDSAADVVAWGFVLALLGDSLTWAADRWAGPALRAAGRAALRAARWMR